MKIRQVVMRMTSMKMTMKTVHIVRFIMWISVHAVWMDDGYAKFDRATRNVNIVPSKPASIPQHYYLITRIFLLLFPYILNFLLLSVYVCLRTCNILYRLSSFIVICLFICPTRWLFTTVVKMAVNLT